MSGSMEMNVGRITGDEEDLDNLTLYKVRFPDLWKKSYDLKNKFYQTVKKEGENWVNAGRGGEEFLEGEKLQHFWHEHCAFCWEKALTDKESTFYCTEDFKCWICEECYNQIKNKFHWEIIPMEELL